MAVLKDILYQVSIQAVHGSTLTEVNDIFIDSRNVKEAGLFIALSGTVTNGHQYIDQAIENGAIAIVCERLPEKLQEHIDYIQVKDASSALGFIASNFYDNPSKKLKLVGVTGTNGKTTIASLLHQMFSYLGHQVGLISTIHYQVAEKSYPSTHTTPNSIVINRLLSEMLEAGCTHCFMEVSSHALAQNRTTGLVFSGGIFTNLSHDHLDYHETFAAYRDAKKSFFDNLPSEAFALTNIDDKNGKVMLQNTKAKKKSYALSSMADFKGRIIENSLEGLLLELDGQQVNTLLIGNFNAYNLLAIYGTSVLLDTEPEEALRALSVLKNAEGRFDYVYDKNRSVLGIVDYAHTPDALEKILQSVNAIRTRNEILITVVGCGGDRDRKKRPEMALIACKMSDKVILTSDNPRSESPEGIIDEMKTGVRPEYSAKVLAITNRRDAIQTACLMAKKGDIILVAGKGHEKYQEINGVKNPFDDKLELKTALDAQEYEA